MVYFLRFGLGIELDSRVGGEGLVGHFVCEFRTDAEVLTASDPGLFDTVLAHAVQERLAPIVHAVGQPLGHVGGHVSDLEADLADLGVHGDSTIGRRVFGFTNEVELGLPIVLVDVPETALTGDEGGADHPNIHLSVHIFISFAL